MTLLLLLGLSVGFMALALRQRPDQGLFGALAPGALPALAMAGMFFWQMQQPGDPDVAALHKQMMASVGQFSDQHLAKPDQAEQRRLLTEDGEAAFRVLPALVLALWLAVLAPIAAWLRRRAARLGRAPQAEALSRWSAPWWLVWGILGPVFWLLAQEASLIQGPPWAGPLAWNVLTLGAALQAFHGSVVLGGKLAIWGGEPRTRALVPLSLGLALAAVLLAGDLLPLLVLAAFTGVFEPWLDLRRLHRPPAGEPLDKGGEA